MSGNQLFSAHVFCTSNDGQGHSFTDLTELDQFYLGDGFRSASIELVFILNFPLHGRVETDPSAAAGEVVVITFKDGHRRVPRAMQDHEGLGVQWDREQQDLCNFILHFGEDVREDLTDRRCVWVRPGVTPHVCFRVHPNKFDEGETISDLIAKARQVVTDQLLTHLPQAA